MTKDATSTFDLTKPADAVQVLPQAPLINSYQSGWAGLTFAHYRHPPYETVEHCLRQHSLVVIGANRCFRAERRWDGKIQRYGHSSGHVDVIPAFLNHQTNWSQSTEFSVIAVCPTLLYRAADTPDIELIPQIAVADPVIQQLSLALKLEIQTGNLSGRLYGESLGMALAARLAQNYTVSRPEFRVGELSRSQLARVMDYIQVHLAQNLSILDLSTLIGMSESYFSRCFKQSVGSTPYRYLMQQRVKRAQQLLSQKSEPISSIAQACGFANQTHLTKVFRQMTGTTPKAYQQQQSR